MGTYAFRGLLLRCASEARLPAVVAQEVYLTRDHLCVVMELAEGGDLAQRMEELHHYGVRPMHQ